MASSCSGRLTFTFRLLRIPILAVRLHAGVGLRIGRRNAVRNLPHYALPPSPRQLTSGHVMIHRAIAIILSVFAVSGCSLVDLAPSVKGGAGDYSNAMDEFTNQHTLLANVLRARDYAPLNFNDLASITGAFSAQGQVALTVPFGPAFPSGAALPTSSNPAMAGATGYTAGSITPSFSSFQPSGSYSVSPSLTLGTLNTQGFMMSKASISDPPMRMSELGRQKYDVSHRL